MQDQMRQDAANSGYMGNLGRFFLYAGTGMARGIGQGLANTDLNNPWRGAGMGILGGSEIGAQAAQSDLQMQQAQAGMPFAIQQQRTASALRLEEYQNKLNADTASEQAMLKTFRAMPRSGRQDSGRTQEEMMNDQGELKIGTSYLSPAGKIFLAQQGLAAARAAQVLYGVRSGVGATA